jgi:predicted CoA-binding protein
MQPDDAFFSGKRYALFGASARGRAHGPVLIRALAKAGKEVVAVQPDGLPIRGATVVRSLAEAGSVDGVVVLPPSPWDNSAADFTREALRQCREHGLGQVWIYTAGDPAPAAALAAEQGISACVGHCPCLYIPGGGFPHNLHRFLFRLTGRA